jgi:hypothetical protein
VLQAAPPIVAFDLHPSFSPPVFSFYLLLIFLVAAFFVDRTASCFWFLGFSDGFSYPRARVSLGPREASITSKYYFSSVRSARRFSMAYGHGRWFVGIFLYKSDIARVHPRNPQAPTERNCACFLPFSYQVRLVLSLFCSLRLVCPATFLFRDLRLAGTNRTGRTLRCARSTDDQRIDI